MKIIEKTKAQIKSIKSKIEIIDELRALIPPLDPVEFSMLEKSILEIGVKDKLTIWEKGDKYYLVDGHHRHQIASRHDKDFDIQVLHFDSQKDVQAWMIEHQLSRRNIKPWQQAYLTGTHRRQMKNSRGGDQKSKGENRPLNVTKHLSGITGISETVIKDNEKFALGIDKLCGTDKQLKWLILNRSKKHLPALEQLTKSNIIQVGQLPESAGNFLRRKILAEDKYFTNHLEMCQTIFEGLVEAGGDFKDKFKKDLLSGPYSLPEDAFQKIVKIGWENDPNALKAIGKELDRGINWNLAIKKVKSQIKEEEEIVVAEKTKEEKIREENRQRAHRIQKETQLKDAPSHKEVAQALLEKKKKAEVDLVAPKPKPTKEEARLEEIKATLAEKIKADPGHNYVCEVGEGTKYYPIAKLKEQEKAKGFMIGKDIIAAYHRIAGIKEDGEPLPKRGEDVKHVLINLAINKGTMLATSKLSDSIIEICRKIFYGWFIEKNQVVLKWVKDQDFARNSDGIANWDIFFSVVKYGKYGKKMNEYLGLVEASAEVEIGGNIEIDLPKVSEEQRKLDSIKKQLSENVKANTAYNHLCVIEKNGSHSFQRIEKRTVKPTYFIISDEMMDAHQQLAGNNDELRDATINLAPNQHTILSVAKLPELKIVELRKILVGLLFEKNLNVLKWLEDQQVIDKYHKLTNAAWDILLDVVKGGRYNEEIKEYLGLITVEDWVAEDTPKQIRLLWEAKKSYYQNMFGIDIFNKLEKMLEDDQDGKIIKQVLDITYEQGAEELTNRFMYYFEKEVLNISDIPKAVAKAFADRNNIESILEEMQKVYKSMEDFVYADLYFQKYFLADEDQNQNQLKAQFKEKMLSFAEKLGIDFSQQTKKELLV